MSRVASQVVPVKSTAAVDRKAKRRRVRSESLTKKRPLKEDELDREMLAAGELDYIPPPVSERPLRWPRKLIKVRGPVTASELLIAERRQV